MQALERWEVTGLEGEAVFRFLKGVIDAFDNKGLKEPKLEIQEALIVVDEDLEVAKTR